MLHLGQKNRIRRELVNKKNRKELSQYESDKLNQIENQNNERSKTKNFNEDMSVSEVEKEHGIFSGLHRSYWNFVSGIAQGPHEALTPLRFGSKFIHDRSAIEDYKKDRLYGNDMALWTNPVKHFVEASVYEALDDIGGLEVPDDTKKERIINEFFDKLEYVKQRRLYKEYTKENDKENANFAKVAFLKTRIGSLVSGLNSESDIIRAMVSLSDKDREYFYDFSREEDNEKRDEILSIVSQEEAEIYKGVWETYDKLRMAKTEEEKERIVSDTPEEIESRASKADKIAEDYINNSIGMPDESFIGWDKRININDVKLKVLKAARENVREYGFWEGDEIELIRKTAINNDKETDTISKNVFSNLVDKYKNKDRAEYNIRKKMNESGVKAKVVEVKNDRIGSTEFITEKSDNNNIVDKRW